MSDETIRVVVVDDHELFRQGIRSAIGADESITIVGEAGDGRQGVDLVARLIPDVVLLDIRMPTMDGIQACAAIKSAHPEVRVLMVTASDSEADLLAAVRAGANGYLLKDVPVAQITTAIHAVQAGQALISPSMATSMLAQFTALVRSADSPKSRLTPRELEIVHLLAEGLSNKDIAARLYLAENTVKNHVKAVLDKLGAKSRTEAVVAARRSGILT